MGKNLSKELSMWLLLRSSVREWVTEWSFRVFYETSINERKLSLFSTVDESFLTLFIFEAHLKRHETFNLKRNWFFQENVFYISISFFFSLSPILQLCFLSVKTSFYRKCEKLFSDYGRNSDYFTTAIWWPDFQCTRRPLLMSRFSIFFFTVFWKVVMRP